MFPVNKPDLSVRVLPEAIIAAYDNSSFTARKFNDVPANKTALNRLVGEIYADISRSRFDEAYNSALFGSQRLRDLISQCGHDATWNGVDKTQSSGEFSHYLAGVIIGVTGDYFGKLSALPTGVVISEIDRSGKDISVQIGTAALRVYNVLSGEVGNLIGALGIADLQNVSQVIKSFSQLIAANITSEKNLFAGALRAAQALSDHLSRRSMYSPTERNLAFMTGLIMSAFVDSTVATNATPAPSPRVVEARPLTKVSAPASFRPDPKPIQPPKEESPKQLEEVEYHKLNTHPLSGEQCKLLAKTLSHIANAYEGLDIELPRNFSRGFEANALEAMGHDILQERGDLECSLADLKLGSQEPMVTQIELVQALAHRLTMVNSAADLSAGYQALAVAVIGLAKESIIELGNYDLPRNFLRGTNMHALTELVEDWLAYNNDEEASFDDFTPIDADSLNKSFNLSDVLEAMGLRFGGRV